MDTMSRSRSTITLGSIPTSQHGRSSLRKPKVSRKEARKQGREGKKRRKAEYFSSTTNNLKRVATSPHPESHPPKKKTVAEPPRPQSSDLPPMKNLSPSRGLAVHLPRNQTTPELLPHLLQQGNLHPVLLVTTSRGVGRRRTRTDTLPSLRPN